MKQTQQTKQIAIEQAFYDYEFECSPSSYEEFEAKLEKLEAAN